MRIETTTTLSMVCRLLLFMGIRFIENSEQRNAFLTILALCYNVDQRNLYEKKFKQINFYLEPSRLTTKSQTMN